jgi:hypothetical protein
MYDPFMAVVVDVPEEYFPDGDDVCLTAGKFVCSRLEPHLVRAGHVGADWLQGGCEEDWGVYFESQLGTETFDYAIIFFPSDDSKLQTRMAVQYHRKLRGLKSWFGKPEPPPADHPIHRTMREFGALFESSRMLTQSEFAAEY